jgi:hypothetical protein
MSEQVFKEFFSQQEIQTEKVCFGDDFVYVRVLNFILATKWQELNCCP